MQAPLHTLLAVALAALGAAAIAIARVRYSRSRHQAPAASADPFGASSASKRFEEGVSDEEFALLGGVGASRRGGGTAAAASADAAEALAQLHLEIMSADARRQRLELVWKLGRLLGCQPASCASSDGQRAGAHSFVWTIESRTTLWGMLWLSGSMSMRRTGLRAVLAARLSAVSAKGGPEVSVRGRPPPWSVRWLRGLKTPMGVFLRVVWCTYLRFCCIYE